MSAAAFDPRSAPALDPTKAAPAVVTETTGPRTWSRVSPSQIVAYKQCPRRWYNASILYDREPSKGFQLKGDAVHKALEVYMSTGEVLPSVTMDDPNSPEGKTTFTTLEFVQVARDFLPPPLTDKEFWAAHRAESGGLMVEQSGELATFEGGPDLVQFVDFIAAYAKDLEAARHPDSKAPALINDYKTTSDFRYAKTPDEVKNDIQLNINAKWLFSVSDYEEIELRLLYLNTKLKTPKVKPVSVVVTRADVERVWARDMAIVQEMAAWAKMHPDTAEKLPPNTESCDMYGGCYYRSKCFGSAPLSVGATSLFSINRPTSSPKGQTMETAAPKPGSILERMLNKAKVGGSGPAASAPVGSAPAASAPAPAAPPVTAAPPSKVAALFGAKVAPAPGPAATPAPQPAPAAAAPQAAPVGVVVPATGPASAPAPAPAPAPANVAALFKKAPAVSTPVTAPASAPGLTDQAIQTGDVGIRPPDAPSPVSTPEEVAAANPETEPEAPAEVAPATAEAATPKRRGRPPKVAPEASTDAPPAPEPGPSPKPDPVPAEPTPTAPASVDKTVEELQGALRNPDPSYTCPVQALFIDCMPGKGWPGPMPEPLSDFMAGFERAAASSAKAMDYRLIRYESKGWLALAIRVMMRGLPAAIYVDTRLPGADIFESVVTPYVTAVFRGTR